MVFQKFILLLLVPSVFSSDYGEVLPLNKKRPGWHYLSTEECAPSPDYCPQTPYRLFDGSCNNLANISLGASYNRYNRLVPANYADGYGSPTIAVNGSYLPNARRISAEAFSNIQYPDLTINLNAMQFGQFFAHDLSFVHTRKLSCCSFDGQMLDNPSNFCYSVNVSEDDAVFSPYNVSCFSLARTVTDEDLGCIGNRSQIEQISITSHYLDLSTLYSGSEEGCKQLRTFNKGKLISIIKNGQELLPLTSSPLCTKINPEEPCFLAGDSRGNQSPHLVLLHTLYLREHNRIAEILAAFNPHWDDERIFQEARKINIAQHQKISYYEWLPLIIGIDNCYIKKILYATEGYVDDYDPNVDPRVLNEFSTAALRFFHTLIAGHLNLFTEHREISDIVRISDYWNRPVLLQQGNNTFDALARGFCTQGAFAADANFDSEITNHWKRSPGKAIGEDLMAICIQRCRDHGLASYNSYRQFCGLKKATTFFDFLDTISFENVLKLLSLYDHPDDVDLTVGGSLERIVPGALAGPTFLCIYTEQFFRTRAGDRFWFENSGQQGFTLPQLNEIKKASISRIICDNTNEIESMQPQGFKKVSCCNDLVPCSSLPFVDLSLWKDTTNTTNSDESI